MVLDLLAKNEFVLKDPEPWVLVDELAGSAVNLRVYFWVNVREVSIFKVSSHLLMAVKNKLLAAGLRFPDPQREVVFTNGLVFERGNISQPKPETKLNTALAPPRTDVRAEALELNRQARESDLPETRRKLTLNF